MALYTNIELEEAKRANWEYSLVQCSMVLSRIGKSREEWKVLDWLFLKRDDDRVYHFTLREGREIDSQ